MITTASGLLLKVRGSCASPLRMSAARLLWGQILLVSMVVLAFLWAATEWTAWRLGFQPQLGPAWFMIGRWPIYQPLALFIWWFQFDAYAPKIFLQGGGIAASGGIAAMAIAIILSVWRAKEAQHVTTYGSARWADKRAERRAGLLGPDGVVLGRLSGATSAITVQNTSCALRLLALARASVLLSQPS